MKSIKFITIILSFLFYSSSIAVEKPVLHIGLFESKPFAFTSANQVQGITKNLAVEIFSKDFNIKFVTMPYTRIIEFINNGRIDLTIMYPNSKIQGGSIEIGSTLGNDNIILSPKNRPLVNAQELKEKKIALIRGANYGKEFENIPFEKLNVSNYDQSIKLLINKRVDGILISSAAWLYYKNDLGLNANEFEISKINFKQNSIFVRKDLPEQTINKIKELNKIVLEKYPDKRLDKLL